MDSPLAPLFYLQLFNSLLTWNKSLNIIRFEWLFYKCMHYEGYLYLSLSHSLIEKKINSAIELRAISVLFMFKCRIKRWKLSMDYGFWVILILFQWKKKYIFIMKLSFHVCVCVSPNHSSIFAIMGWKIHYRWNCFPCDWINLKSLYTIIHNLELFFFSFSKMRNKNYARFTPK